MVENKEKNFISAVVYVNNNQDTLMNLLNKINDLYKNNDYEKLSYLYYEYFNKIENNKEEIYNNLIKSINNFNYKHNVLYNILKLSEQK